MDMHVLTSLAKQNLPPQYVPLWHANCFQLKQSRPKDSGRMFDLHPNCLAGASLVAQMVKNLPTMQETQVRSGSGRSPGEGNGICYPLQHSPAWRIPWTEEPGGLQFRGLQRVGHDSAINTLALPWWFRW